MEAFTWYRDSHGLFDYEEKEKITHCAVQASKNCKYQNCPESTDLTGLVHLLR